MAIQNGDKLITEREVRDLTGLSHTSIWRWQLDGKFPQRRVISSNRIGWLRSEILNWMATLPAATQPPATTQETPRE
jgi:predicted DNA-binding transcriptional regulator AlpA